MKFVMVNKSRLNVYLSKDEIVKEHIDLKEIFTQKCNIKEKLTSVFAKAKDYAGFNIDNYNLKIELIPIVDGDLLISVKRLNSSNNKLITKTLIFCFHELEDLFTAVKKYTKPYIASSSLYKYDDKYYLMTYILTTREEKLKRFMLSMLRFGEKSEFSHAVLEEHGQKLMDKNAVNVILKHF